MDTVKQMAVPKSSRLLVEERALVPPDSSTQMGRQNPVLPSVLNKEVKGKTSSRRLTDILHPGHNSIGGKKDLWLVVFNDVVLRCQRTGITSLPPSCVFYKFKYEFVARATSERQVCYHRTQRGAYQTPESL